MSGRQALRQALHDHTRHAIRTQQTAHRATVTGTHPLVVEVFGRSHPLVADNDFELTQWARLYDHVVGIAVGDAVLMIEHDDEWALQDVLSDKDVAGKFNSWNVDD